MNKKEALKILHEMQKWRRRNGKNSFHDPMPYTPRDFGLAIDFAIRYMRKNGKNETKVGA